MILNINEIKSNMMVIYKINYHDGHFYIGFTNDLQRRLSEHRNAWKKMPYQKIQDCDIAIYQQGGIDEIEILEFVTDVKQLETRELYWIQYYNAYNDPMGYNNTPGGNAAQQFGEDSPKAVFTNSEVLDIRRRRYEGERKKDVYQDYTDKNFSTFEKIWLGHGYSDIGKEFLIAPHSISRQEYSHKANNGLNNGRAKCTKENIIDIRQKYENGMSIADIAILYPNISKSTVRRIALKQVYKDVK